jgi:hypothetical protein
MNALSRNARNAWSGLAGWLAAALLAGLVNPVAAQAQPQLAGKVLMAVGTVSLVRDGKEIPAPRDTAVLAGDLLRTGASSNAQLRLQDGAIIALRPNSDFKINAFNYSGKADGSESASLSLLKGGVRAVTGVIGRTNRDNLKVDAVVATIGIRGTGFNVVLCDAACQALHPTAKGGLYAGVFEGRIAVDNAAGSAVELGLNQFLHVADAQSAPTRLLAPPALLKDRLESQGGVKTSQRRVGDGASDDARQVVERAPVTVPLDGNVVAVNRVNSVALAPPTGITAPPMRFYDLPGMGDALPLLTAKPANTHWSFQSAEFNPLGAQRRADNQVLEGVNGTTALAFTQYDGYKLQTVTKDGVVDAYVIRNGYTATQQEGGADGGVIAWGRWAGGTALIGNYGTVSYTDAQGFHWIAGARLYDVPAEIRNQRFAFNLIGATRPTEAYAGALPGWRVYGGNLNANFGSTNVAVDGTLNLYLIRSSGTGNYNMTFSGSSDPSSIAFTRVNASVVRTQGDVPVCVSACGGAGVVSFYGSQASHAGLTYEFNTGTSYVQGAAAFKR